MTNKAPSPGKQPDIRYSALHPTMYSDTALQSYLRTIFINHAMNSQNRIDPGENDWANAESFKQAHHAVSLKRLQRINEINRMSEILRGETMQPSPSPADMSIPYRTLLNGTTGLPFPPGEHPGEINNKKPTPMQMAARQRLTRRGTS